MIKFNLYDQLDTPAALEKELAEIQKTIFMGQKCEAFLDNELGQYLLDKSIEESEVVSRELLVTDPEDAKTIRELQMRAAVSNKLFSWVYSAIIEKNNAEQKHIVGEL